MDSRPSTICRQCIMDTTDSQITFEDGICNHCRSYNNNLQVRVVSQKDREAQLEQLVQTMKKH